MTTTSTSSMTSTATPTISDALSRPARGPRRVRRSVGAVLGGLVAIFAVTTATDVVMHLLGVFPPLHAPPMSNGLFLLALAYRVVYDVAGGALTARLAPDRPMGHALALGGIGVALSIVGAVVMRGAGPAWYPLALAASALPSAWLGARLAARR
jgi:hypothetical protein